MYKSINIKVYFCQNEIKLCITTSHVKSIRDFYRENTLSGVPETFLISNKVSGSPDKVFSLETPKNSHAFPVK